MKHFLLTAALVLAPALQAIAASIADYPTRTVRLVVPFAPGALNDTIARLVSDKLAASLGRTVIVENKPGAGSQIGTGFVAKAAPNGEVLLFGAADGLTVLPAIKPSVGYAVPDGFTFITRVGTGPFALVVSSALPVNTFEEFVKYAAANPKAVRHGTPGNGSVTHTGAALIEQETGIQLTQVHYQGMAGAVNDLLAGHIDAALISPPTIAPHLKGGKVKVLAVMGPSRHKLLPDVPFIDELGRKGLHVVGWWGVLAPAGLPGDVAERLSRDMSAILDDKAFRAQLEDRGIEVSPLSGTAFRQFAVDDLRKWKALSQRAKISLD
jgi:tripartite-type tricarboxylate transporter receptor subunit TctC